VIIALVGKKKKGEEDAEMDTDDEDQQILDTLTCLRLRGPCAVKKRNTAYEYA